jgi:tetratricopeptide (TPR) repeat protein
MNEFAKAETPDIHALQEEVEKRVSSAAARSRVFRVTTVALAVLWVCIGAVFFSKARKEQQLKAEQIRASEQAKLAEVMKRNEEENARLRTQAENSRLAGAYVASGVFKASHGDGNGALADYKKALACDPDNSAALSYDGYLRLRLGQNQKAEEMLARAVQVDPNQVWNRYNYALALWANGKHSEAISQVQEVLRLDSTFKSTIANDGQFNSFRSDPTFRELIRH